jgi:hypothetical protein
VPRKIAVGSNIGRSIVRLGDRIGDNQPVAVRLIAKN